MDMVPFAVHMLPIGLDMEVIPAHKVPRTSLNRNHFVVARSTEQGTGPDRLLPSHEPTRRLRLASDLRHDHLQRQERRRTEHNRDQLRTKVRRDDDRVTRAGDDAGDASPVFPPLNYVVQNFHSSVGLYDRVVVVISSGVEYAGCVMNLDQYRAVSKSEPDLLPQLSDDDEQAPEKGTCKHVRMTFERVVYSSFIAYI